MMKNLHFVIFAESDKRSDEFEEYLFFKSTHKCRINAKNEEKKPHQCLSNILPMESIPANNNKKSFYMIRKHFSMQQCLFKNVCRAR